MPAKIHLCTLDELPVCPCKPVVDAHSEVMKQQYNTSNIKCTNTDTCLASECLGRCYSIVPLQPHIWLTDSFKTHIHQCTETFKHPSVCKHILRGNAISSICTWLGERRKGKEMFLLNKCSISAQRWRGWMLLLGVADLGRTWCMRWWAHFNIHPWRDKTRSPRRYIPEKEERVNSSDVSAVQKFLDSRKSPEAFKIGVSGPT